MSNHTINFRLLAEEVIKRLDILEVAENEGLRLKKTGKNYFTHCPFHSERTPSFSINPKKRMFYCFSCHKGGNVITFLSALKGVSKGKVIYQYANAYGLINNSKVSRSQQQVIKQRMIKHEFKKKEESNFEQVYGFLCDQVHAFRRAMKQVKTLEERDALQEHYQIYDRVAEYEGLLEYMSGDFGDKALVQAYLRGEVVMKEWNSRINN
jgi:DNA primase